VTDFKADSPLRHLPPLSMPLGNLRVPRRRKLVQSARDRLRRRKQALHRGEYGTTGNKQSIKGAWQPVAISTSGIAGDMFWQWGETLSTGQTHNDGYTIYYQGGADYDVLVVNHVKAIGDGTGGGTTSTTSRPVMSSSGTRATSSTTRITTSATPRNGSGQPRWAQCGGQGWTGGTTCQSPRVCTYSNPWYSQCL
jgi:mannan endo-1,4-beta-mannosidase